MSLDVLDSLPTYDVDLFIAECLRDPFPHYRAIRDLGPVVWLTASNIPVISRHADVQAALRAPEALVSGEGVGFNEDANRQPPERGVLTSDGERHRRLRSALSKPLMPAMIRQHRPLLKEMASRRVISLAHGETFEAVEDLARFLPLNAVTKLVGLADAETSKMLAWASAFFNFMGPIQEQREGLPDLARDRELRLEVQEFFASVDPRSFKPGSWSHNLFEKAGDGKLSDTELRGALRAYVIPSLDTTILTKAVLLHALAQSPDQWRLLKGEPDLIPSAALEAVRYGSVVRAFSRLAAMDYEAGDVRISTGQRVMLLFGAANRDERKYDQPDKFDVTRNPTDHVGWGTGPHMCVGMHLAKMEIEVMLEALVEHVDTIEADAPDLSTISTLYGVTRLPLRLRPS